MLTLLTMWSVTVTVNRNGLVAKGLLGWPQQRVAMSDIVRVEAVTVSALRDFGGYGYRLAVRGNLKGAQGFVLRSGSALLLTRVGGRRAIVVVDDAQTAAGLINGVVSGGLR